MSRVVVPMEIADMAVVRHEHPAFRSMPALRMKVVLGPSLPGGISAVILTPPNLTARDGHIQPTDPPRLRLQDCFARLNATNRLASSRSKYDYHGCTPVESSYFISAI